MSDRDKIGKLFRAHWEERTSSDAVRKALETMIPSSSKATLPVDVEIAAKYVGIEQVLEVEMTNSDGLLSSTLAGTYIASLREGLGNARKRFTLAHEIGHVVVYRSIGRLTSRASDGPLQCRAETADERDEERLCDLIAAELLMPRAQFSQAMDEIGVCASTIPEIASQYGVSLQAACRRIVEILPYNIGAGLWIMNGDSSRIIPKWYLTKKGALSLEHTIEVGHPGSTCFTDQVVRGWHWIPLLGQMDKYFVDVCPIYGAKKAWIVLVVFGSAAQHIITKISHGRPPIALGQLPLVSE